MEKRNLGKAVTPPAFDEKSRTQDELRSLLPKEEQVLAKLRGYQKLNGVAVVVNAQHLKSLIDQMDTAQKTVDRYNKELSTPMSRSDKITIEHEKDGFQAKIDYAAEELADILVYLYS